MNSLRKTQQTLLIAALIATLTALYFYNSQLSNFIAIALIALLISISLILLHHRDNAEEPPSAIDSKFAVKAVVLMCALISIYLISVSSETLFSEPTHTRDSSTLEADPAEPRLLRAIQNGAF